MGVYEDETPNGTLNNLQDAIDDGDVLEEFVNDGQFITAHKDEEQILALAHVKQSGSGKGVLHAPPHGANQNLREFGDTDRRDAQLGAGSASLSPGDGDTRLYPIEPDKWEKAEEDYLIGTRYNPLFTSDAATNIWNVGQATIPAAPTLLLPVNPNRTYVMLKMMTSTCYIGANSGQVRNGYPLFVNQDIRIDSTGEIWVFGTGTTVIAFAEFSKILP